MYRKWESTPPNYVGKPPRWARRMLRRHQDIQVSELVWRRSRTHTYSSGRAWYGWGRIVITAGLNEDDARLALLHELSHIAVRRRGHDEAFWRKHWELACGERGMREALLRDHRNGPRSLCFQVAKELKIDGVYAELRARKEERARERQEAVVKMTQLIREAAERSAARRGLPEGKV